MQYFKKIAKAYGKNTSGNMAIIFSLCLTLVFVAVGAAVDINMANNKKIEYQGLADSAVLAAARSGLGKKKDTDEFGNNMLKIAKSAVEANNTTGDKLKVKLKIFHKTGKIRVTVSSKRKTILMSMFGKNKVGIEAVSEAPLTISDPANIVLVLDTTYSMTGSKIDTLKSVANDLVDTLKDYDNENLRMGVVPFSQYVNVGLSRRNEAWLTDTTDYQVKTGDNCYFPVTGQTNCRTVTYGPTSPSPASTCYNDGVAYSCGGSSGSPGGSYTACDNVYGTTEVCNAQFANYTWYGCVGSRTTPWHKRANYNSKKIPGLYNTKCGTEIRTLTNNLTDVTATINALTPNGETYLPSGLMWGWRMLTRQEPLIEAKAAYKNNTQNIMIFMTDGSNTKSKNYSSDQEKLHNSSDRTDADNLSKTLCKKINQDKIQVYSVAFQVSDVQAKNVVRNCASDVSMFYDASDNAALKAAFESIGQSLLKLRLTH